MKDVNQNELSALVNAKVTYINGTGKPPGPLTLTIGSMTRELTELSDIYHTMSGLQRLILFANLYLELNRVWPVVTKPSALRNLYTSCHAIFSCVTHCCDNDLIEFLNRWGNPFKYSNFSRRHCPVGDQNGEMCGFGVKCLRKPFSLPCSDDQV
jgi:hypothetical protein